MITKINNARDHAKALAEIDRLWETTNSISSPDNQKLVRLVQLVDAYEKGGGAASKPTKRRPKDAIERKDTDSNE